MRRDLGAGALRVDFALGFVDHRLMDAVFDERRTALGSPQSLGVGFVLGKEQVGRSATGQPVVTKFVMLGMHETNVWCFTRWPRCRGPIYRAPIYRAPVDCRQHRPPVVIPPGPGLPEPRGGEQVLGAQLRSAPVGDQ